MIKTDQIQIQSIDSPRWMDECDKGIFSYHQKIQQKLFAIYHVYNFLEERG